LKVHRIILGVANLALIGAWVTFVQWGHGMSAFGGGAQGTRADVLEYAPLLVFALILCSVISPVRYLLHMVAAFVVPCVLLTVYLLFTNLNVGFWLAFYFGLWCEMYYKLAWKRER
jgi:hypothetical protein